MCVERVHETARIHHAHRRCSHVAARCLGPAEQIIPDRLSCLCPRRRLNHNHATAAGTRLSPRREPGVSVPFRGRTEPELLDSLAAELVNARPDVLISGFGTLPAKAAKAATSTIPIVFASVGDPLGAGLINSLNRPGANVTGVTSEASDVVGKRLQLFDELVPGKRTVAVLMNPDTPFSELALRELKTAAVAAAQPIQVFEARSFDQVLAGVEAAAKAGAAGLLTLEDALLVSTRRQIAERATTTRLPIVYGSRAFPEAGGLISYGVDRRHMYRRAAEYVDRFSRVGPPPSYPWSSQLSSSL
jgi:putative tryptophan/tyrosine transport system substrate-binding protein